LDDVLAVLGVADADLLFGALDAIAAGDPRAALLAADRLNESGRDASQFVRDLEAHARDLLVVGTLGGDVPAELSVSPERDARLAEQAGRVSRGAVVRLLDLLAAGLEAVKAGAAPGRGPGGRARDRLRARARVPGRAGTLGRLQRARRRRRAHRHRNGAAPGLRVPRARAARGPERRRVDRPVQDRVRRRRDQ